MKMSSNAWHNVGWDSQARGMNHKFPWYHLLILESIHNMTDNEGGKCRTKKKTIRKGIAEENDNVW